MYVFFDNMFFKLVSTFVHCLTVKTILGAGLSKETQKALNKYSQMTAQPATDFVDSFEIGNFIQLKGFFNRSTTALNRALNLV